jgi:transposase
MRSRDAETRRRYDAEFREGAVRIVRETGKPIAQVARDLGIHDGTLGHWVNKDRIERGEKEGLTVDERTRLQQLERENSSCAWSVMSSSSSSRPAKSPGNRPDPRAERGTRRHRIPGGETRTRSGRHHRVGADHRRGQGSVVHRLLDEGLIIGSDAFTAVSNRRPLAP